MPFESLKFPKLIFETVSDYSGKIEVFQAGKTRSLAVDRYVQSINWDSPFVEKRVWGVLASLIQEKRPEAKSALILGLGGGTLCHLISKAMPKVQMVAIEIDKVMIDVAKEYFDLDSIPNLKIIRDDAFRVIAESEKYDIHKDSFDVVVMDIYSGGEYPELASSGTFFSGLKRLVRPGGLLVFNRIYFGSHQHEVDEFCNLLREVFGDVHKKTVPGRTNSDNVLIYVEV